MHADGSSTDVVTGDGSGVKGLCEFPVPHILFSNPLLPLDMENRTQQDAKRPVSLGLPKANILMRFCWVL